MKFSEIEAGQWPELQPYLDTCLIPFTGMEGEENPEQAIAALEKLRDVLDLLEIPFKGRVVTYPAFHYSSGSWEKTAQALDRLCRKYKEKQFKFAIVVSAVPWPSEWKIPHADLIVEGPAEREMVQDLSKALQEKVQAMWNKKLAEDEC